MTLTKEQIHTIPVLDALRDPNGCPFCAMRQKLEQNAVEFIMGPAYMEDDVRMDTNRLGFCGAHIEKMYASQNRLGLALMLHTYMQRLNRDTDTAIKNRLPVPRFKKGPEGPTARLREKLEAAEETCYVCNMVERTFERYMDTFFVLWSSDREAAKLIEDLPGYCLPHFTKMLRKAEERLNKGKLTAFLDTVIPAQQSFMKQLEEDLEWFTLKFDYRNKDAPWKNAKNALPRAMALLHGVDLLPLSKEGLS